VRICCEETTRILKLHGRNCVCPSVPLAQARLPGTSRRQLHQPPQPLFRQHNPPRPPWHLPLPAPSLSPRRKVTGRDGKRLGISEKALYPRLNAMGFARRSRVAMCVGLFVALATIASCGADDYAEVRTPAIGRGDWHEILWVVRRCGSDEGAYCYVPYGDTDIIWLHVSLS